MIVVFGSINADLIFVMQHLPQPGQTLLAQELRIEAGGKGANQAVAAARDGAEVVMAGAVGADNLAESGLAGLRGAGVDLSRVVPADAATGCASICTDAAGRNQIAVAPGANLLARERQVEDGLLGPGTTLLVQMETEGQETERLILRARSHGARILLNLAPALPLALQALQATDLLVINEDEAACLANRLGSGVDAGALHAALGVTVIRTLGGEGAEAADNDGLIRLPASPVEVVDTTGAGDCFVGVLGAALDKGIALAQALRRAGTAAALSCTRRGTQSSLPTAAEIDAALG
ncbi:MAG: ribokinase [Acetobacteraceae bacterium]|nr:ribokinase [Acetobacteraceae bacterium]MBV8524399.1 ribokinase [Acetobacteraceae bacterium]